LNIIQKDKEAIDYNEGKIKERISRSKDKETDDDYGEDDTGYMNSHDPEIDY